MSGEIKIWEASSSNDKKLPIFMSAIFMSAIFMLPFLCCHFCCIASF